MAEPTLRQRIDAVAREIGTVDDVLGRKAELTPDEQDQRVMLRKWRAALLALPDGPTPLSADEWQPIETAPKDGTLVLLYQPDGQWHSERRCRGMRVDTGYWHQPANRTAAGFWCPTIRPTYWMPLPKAPCRTHAETQKERT